ncbi:MAG TPA: hypothetical protein VKY32_04610 [Flavobacterium sp.]|nr:hypothetical protein [Flavobacterium sp.]
MKTILTCLTILFSLNFFGQNLTEAEYIQVNKKYAFQDEENQYRLNSSLKSRLEKRGYQVYFAEDGIPEEVRQNPCKKLICNMDKGSGWLSTTVEIELTDCNGNIVAKSEGNSRLKNRKKSYPEALDIAVRSLVLPEIK